MKGEKNMDNIKSFILSNIAVIILSITTLIFIGTSIYFYSLDEECEVCPEVVDSKEVKEKFYIDIKGSVKNPGVYEVEEDMIINDVVNLAGGFTKNAYTKNINLSKKIENEMVLMVYTTSEVKKKNKPVNEINTECSTTTYDINNCITNGSSSIKVGEVDTPVINDSSSENEKPQNSIVNINTASKEELQTLPGIGASKADNIINYRNSNGNFKTIEDIKNVNGIGDSVYEQIKDRITV